MAKERDAIKALEQESASTRKYGVLHKIAEFFSNWGGDENAKMEISVNDMREIADISVKKARAEWQLSKIKGQQQKYNTSEWCHDCREYDQEKHCCPRFNRVIRNAVEEMKQPCEDDAISRQAAIDAIFAEPLYKPGMKKRYAEEAVPAIFEKIKLLPPVQPKQRVGHWIYDKRIENWKCSECGCSPKTIGYVGRVEFMREHFKFCNHCGAKMIEPQESEDKE